MNSTDIRQCQRVATVRFWEGYAKWYKLWLDHTEYHKPIVRLLKEMVKPGWRVLDIGAGSGVLSFPLAEMGCKVTALEPSLLMRSFLFNEMFQKHEGWVEVDDRRWEDVSLLDYREFDLILSCNTLHLTSIGFDAALEKIFASDATHVLIATEHIPTAVMRFAYESHVIAFARTYKTDSSFAYHRLSQVFDHHRYKTDREPDTAEKRSLTDRAVARDGHLWLEDQAQVGMYWLRRREKDLCVGRQRL
jgi:SAM-dependent methyltransferase